MVLLVLAVIWAAVLVPPMWRNRAEGRPADSIKQFHRHLRVLNGTEPHGYSRALTAQAGSPVITAPMAYRGSTIRSTELRRRRSIERRRNILFGLTGAALFTLFLALLSVPMMLPLHLLADVLLGGYVALLANMKKSASDREMKLRYLPQQRSVLDLREEAPAWGEFSSAAAH